MKTFLLFMLSVFSAAIVFSQPQAPIEWGEARWAHLAGWPGLPQITTLRVIPIGDTLLFTAVNIGSPVSDTILVCSSFDNGQTFTPWIRITDGRQSTSASFAGSAGRFYCFMSQGAVQPSAVWLLTSDDGGLTWSLPQQYQEDAYSISGFASGEDVLAQFGGQVNNNWSTCVFWSDNGGRGWSLPMVIDTAVFYSHYRNQSIAFTATNCLVLEQPANDYHLYLARSDRTWQNWTTFQPLPGNLQVRSQVIYGDTATETAGILAVGAGNTPVLFRTTDGGGTWGNQVLSDSGVVGATTSNVPLLIGNGQLWMIGWSHVQPQWGDYLAIRFSANHGRNWYPIQMAADSLAMTLVTSGQIRGNQIDLYWMQACWGLPQQADYRMVTGTITADTTYPVITPVTAPPETVRVGQSYPFSVSVTDNDTLSDVRLLIVGLSGDTLRNTMAQNGNQLYHFSWEVPDSGYYRYWYEAEDWWENVAFLPDSGTYHFMTEGWTSASDVILHPSAFSVSVSPNPFNAITEITFTLPKTQPVSLRIYDVLGREVSVLVDEVKIAGEHHVTFNAAGFSSGTYWCRMEAGGFVKTQRIVLLK